MSHPNPSSTPKPVQHPFKTVTEVHAAFNKKIISPLEFTRELLNSAKTSQSGAFLTLCEDRAITSAVVATDILNQEGQVPRDRMPLFGIPLGVKDLITIEGVKTTAGSKTLENYIPPYTATCISLLESAGAIILGKTNLDEFGMGSSNENSAFGPVQHPTHPDRVPGGSSGGSAAAVKGGLCVAALGTDTGGSIRLPASFCGVVGLKPTYGRISRYGQIAYASSLDQIGPLAHNVEDAALLFDVMSGHDPLDSTCSPRGRAQGYQATRVKLDWSAIRIGVPKEYMVEGLAPEVEKAIQNSLEWFKQKGARIKPISLPHSPYSVAVYYVVAVSEASSNLARMDGVRFGNRPFGAAEAKNLAEYYQKVRANFGPEVKRRIILGTFALSSGYSEAYYKRACQVRRKIKEDFDNAFREVDLIVGPVSPTTAFKVGEKISDPLQMYLNDIFTIPVNLAGLPAISVPCGNDGEGLSIGLQMIAPAFGEERLLSAAHSFFERLS